MKYLEWGMVACMVVLTLLGSLSQTIIYQYERPADTVYAQAHNFLEDYYYYLHIMRQGRDGYWTATSRLTVQEHPGRFVVVFFLLVGHMSRWFHLSLPISYTILRGLGGMSLLISIYVLICYFIPKNQIKRYASFLFIILGGGFWHYASGQVRLPELVHDWTELDTLSRWTFIPHHLWSKVFFVLLVYVLIRSIHTPKRIHFVTIVLFVLLMGFCSPVTIATFLPMLTLWIAMEGISKWQDRRIPWKILGTSAVAASTALFVAIYHRWVQTDVFPWTSYLTWEHVIYPITLSRYIASFGPLLILFLVGMIPLWKKGSDGRMIIAWMLSGGIMIFFVGRFLPLSNSRFLGGYQYIPLGIGALYGVDTISSWVKSRVLSTSLWYSIVFCVLAYSLVGWWGSWQTVSGYIAQNMTNPQVYIPDDWWNTMRFLDETVREHDVVMAPAMMSTMIPAFSSGRVIWGHPMMTEYAQEARKNVDAYMITSDLEAMHQIESVYHPTYIVSDHETLTKILTQRSDMSLAYHRGGVSVFRVGISHDGNRSFMKNLFENRQ